MNNDDLYVKVQRAKAVDPEKITHQPQSYRVMAAMGDWVLLQGMSLSMVYFKRSTGLQRNESHRIVAGLEKVPTDYFVNYLGNREDFIRQKLQELNAE